MENAIIVGSAIVISSIILAAAISEETVNKRRERLAHDIALLLSISRLLSNRQNVFNPESVSRRPPG